LSLSEYAETVESLVLDMNIALTTLENDREIRPQTVESEQAYYAARVVAREDFIAALRALEPPTQVEELHARGLVIMERLLAAEATIATRAAAMTSYADVYDLWTDENVAEFMAADEDAYRLCRAAQAEFDATQDEAVAAGTPWVPNEMREVVRVALACEQLDLD
jgi:hypothetical protein